MQKIKLIAVGALNESYYKEAVAEYKKRLSALCTFEEVRLKESSACKVSGGKSPTDAQICAALDEEGDAILAAVPKRARLVALCIEGKQMTSEALAAYIGDAAVSGDGEICFVIGSSHGLSDKVKKAADLRLSMSALTFPHRLAAVMLCEAIYRSFEILKGTKYHK